MSRGLPFSFWLDAVEDQVGEFAAISLAEEMAGLDPGDGYLALVDERAGGDRPRHKHMPAPSQKPVEDRGEQIAGVFNHLGKAAFQCSVCRRHFPREISARQHWQDAHQKKGTAK
jgi:hypothetical protein